MLKSNVCNIPFIITAFTADTTAPVTVTCPPAVTVTSSVPIVVTYWAASATSKRWGFPRITYSHASGSTFALGVTTVTVTAIDPSNDWAQCTFTITVSARKF